MTPPTLTDERVLEMDRINMKTKPYPCPKHPDGLIEHSYDLTQTVLNGLPSGEGVKSNHKYTCHDCGMELETLDEFCERTRTEERLKKDSERAAKNILNGWKP